MKEKYIILATPSPITNATSEENLGVEYIVANCRAHGYEVDFIDGWLLGYTPEKMVEVIMNKPKKPLFVAFSCYLLNKAIVCNIVEMLKEKNYDVPFVAGGYGPTFTPEDFLNSGFDYITICEGEVSTVKLADYLYYGDEKIENIAGIGYHAENGELKINNAEGIENLDDLPFPSREYLDITMKEHTAVNMSSSRGCIANCVFCSVSTFWRLGKGKKYRSRSAQNVVDEIEELYKQGVEFIKFVDDSFIEDTRDEKWCKDFADELIRRNIKIRFRVSMRVNGVTEGVIKHLCRAGLKCLQLGVENFSEKPLRRIGKLASVEDNIAALDIIKKYKDKYKICLQMGFILFDYESTLDEIEENINALEKYSWAITRGFTEMYASMNTPYATKLLKMNVAKPVAFGNYSYVVRDPKAKQMYDALKAWHVHYLSLYDKAIDPMTKPKALSNEGFDIFEEFYKGIKQVEIKYFKDVLNLVKNNATQEEIDNYVKNSIENSNEWIQKETEELNEIYRKQDIWYKAASNPFINNSGK